jgi:hypothetical protein
MLGLLHLSAILSGLKVSPLVPVTKVTEEHMQGYARRKQGHSGPPMRGVLPLHFEIVTNPTRRREDAARVRWLPRCVLGLLILFFQKVIRGSGRLSDCKYPGPP